MKEREIRIAKSAGFCFGVERAVDMVYKQLEEVNGPLYTYGPIIHNESVVEDLKEKGVVVIDEEESLDKYTPGTVVIRSHGVGAAVIDELTNRGFSVVDATCPFVLKIHNIVREASEKGDSVLVIGNENHPEVRGILGWIKDTPVEVAETAEDAASLSLPKDQKLCVVAQTTFRQDKFQELVEIIKQKGYDIYALSTICNATATRQKEAKEVAAWADVMLVIGGKSSSNSQKLFSICQKECEKTYFIQTAKDLDPSLLQSIRRVGITAGASTPNKIIEEVQKKCQK